MTEAIVCATLVVRDYDESIEYFTRALGFALLEDSPWATAKALGRRGTRSLDGYEQILLARASTPAQERCIGNQTGGRVSFFLSTGDFTKAHAAMRQQGVQFHEEPRSEPYGTVAVFADLYGNRWDLLEPRREASSGRPQERRVG